MPVPAERRTTGRWRVDDNVVVEIVGRARALRLINVGAGGFAVASEQMLAAIANPEFKFTRPDKNWSISLKAQMAYCLLKPKKDGAAQGKYVTGYTFLDAAVPEVQGRIREFLSTFITPQA